MQACEVLCPNLNFHLNATAFVIINIHPANYTNRHSYIAEYTSALIGIFTLNALILATTRPSAGTAEGFGLHV